MENMNPTPIKTIENIEHGGKQGYIKVFSSEYEAENSLEHNIIGALVCANGYYNGIFIPY